MIEALTLRGLEDGIRAKIMMEALTLRGLEDPDTIKPKNRKSEKENQKLKTETRHPVLDGNLAKIMMEALTLRGL